MHIPKLILLSSISCHATIINRPEMGGGVSLMALGSLEISNNLAFEINEMMSKMTSDEIANEICKLYELNPKQWEDIIAECRRRNFISLQQQDSNGDFHGKKKFTVGKGETIATPFSKQIQAELNKVRSNPLAYVVHLETRLCQFIDEFVYSPNGGGLLIQTKEGKSLVKETIEYLKLSSSICPVSTSEYLELAAIDHVKDMFEHNLMGHGGSDGSTTKDRIERHCKWQVVVGETIDFGSIPAVDVVVNLLIDDGVPSRGHRLNLMNPDFKVIGASSGLHPTYGQSCVVDFAGGVLSFDDVLHDDCLVRLISAVDLEQVSFRKVIASIPYNGDLGNELQIELLRKCEITIDYQHFLKTAKISVATGGKTTIKTLTWH